MNQGADLRLDKLLGGYIVYQHSKHSVPQYGNAVHLKSDEADEVDEASLLVRTGKGAGGGKTKKKTKKTNEKPSPACEFLSPDQWRQTSMHLIPLPSAALKSIRLILR